MQQLHRIEDAEMTTARASCHQIATEMNTNATSLCTTAHAMRSPPPLQTPGELDHLTFAGEHEDLLPFSLHLPTWFPPHLPEFPSFFETYFISSLLQWNLYWSPWTHEQNRHLSLWIPVTHSLSSSKVLPCIKSHVKAFFENFTLWRGLHSLCVWQKWSPDQTLHFLAPYSLALLHN